MNTTGSSRIGRRLRIFSGVIFLLLALAALAALFLLFERWRGERDYWKHRRALEAEGEVFELADFRPAPVPDEQNFATTPLLRPLYPAIPRQARSEAQELVMSIKPCYVKGVSSLDARRGAHEGWQAGQRVDLGRWQAYYHSATNLPLAGPDASPAQDVLAALSRFDAELAEIAEASKRPYCWFPLDLEAGPSMLMPHISVIHNLGRCYALRAGAHLAAGNPRQSAEDILAGLRLAGHGSEVPLLTTLLVRETLLDINVQPLWDGLSDGVWTEEQLAAFQAQLSQFDFVRDSKLLMRGERSFFQYIAALGPAEFHELIEVGFEGGGTRFPPIVLYCFVHHNALYMNRFYAEHVLPAIDEERQRIDAQAISAAQRKLESEEITLKTYLSFLLAPALKSSVTGFAHAQTVACQAMLACALERYRLRHGAYPESLDALVPEFVSELPHDVITGEPLRYRIEPAGRYILYATGWDGTDDGGVSGMAPGRKVPYIQELQSGDWVWRLAE